MEVVILKRIILTTESCSDLSKEILEEHNIPSVPFSLNFLDKTVDDGQIPVQEIYDFYRDTKEIPKTNAITPYKYTEFFDGIAKKIQMQKSFIKDIPQPVPALFKMQR